MALTFLSGMTFEAQDELYGVTSSVAMPIVTTPTHPIPEATYVAKLNWKTGPTTLHHIASTTNWLTYSFYVNFTNVNDTYIFFKALDGNNANMVTMEMGTTPNRITWRNATGAEIDHKTGILTDRWYLISIKFKPENSSTSILVTFDKSVHSISTANTDPGGATGSYAGQLKNPIPTGLFYSAGMTIVEDDSSGIEDDPLSYIHDFIGFWYDSSEGGVVPDIGTNLSAGNWNNMQELGGIDANTGTYTVGSPAKSGVISSDDGPTRAGPKNDADVQKWEILGAIWAMRAKKQSGSDFLGQSAILKYGAHSSAHADGTTNAALVTITTAFKQWQISKSVLDPETPLLSEWAQVGFQVGAPLSIKSVICSELRCYVFFRIFRDIKDHPIIRPIRHRADPAPF